MHELTAQAFSPRPRKWLTAARLAEMSHLGARNFSSPYAFK